MSHLLNYTVMTIVYTIIILISAFLMKGKTESSMCGTREKASLKLTGNFFSLKLNFVLLV